MWTEVWGTGSGSAFSDTGKFGLVGKLNTELAAMFNETTVKALRRQCQNEAESCVKRECGAGYRSCYINDPWKSLSTATANAAGGFDADMARSLCMIPVKRSETCEAYFDIELAETLKNGKSDSWGSGFSTRAMWAGAGASGDAINTSAPNASTQAAADLYFTARNSSYEKESAMAAACSADAASADCTAKTAAYDTAKADEDSKYSSLRSTAQNNDQTIRNALSVSENALNLFTNLIADVSAAARAQLTKEQNAVKNRCEQHRGQSSFNNTYLWAEKPSTTGADNSLATNLSAGNTNMTFADTYPIMGLGDRAAKVGTAKLWGAFCQVEVRLTSTDRDIKRFLEGDTLDVKEVRGSNGNEGSAVGSSAFWENFGGIFTGASSLVPADCKNGDEKGTCTLKSKPNAYFSLGDAIMCGSWLKESDIDVLGQRVATVELEKGEASRDWISKNAGWIGGAIGAIGGGIGGGILANNLAKKADEKSLKENPACQQENLIAKQEELTACLRAVESKDYISRGGSNLCKFSGISGVKGAEKSILLDEGTAANDDAKKYADKASEYADKIITAAKAVQYDSADIASAPANADTDDAKKDARKTYFTGLGGAIKNTWNVVRPDSDKNIAKKIGNALDRMIFTGVNRIAVAKDVLGNPGLKDILIGAADVPTSSKDAVVKELNEALAAVGKLIGQDKRDEKCSDYEDGTAGRTALGAAGGALIGGAVLGIGTQAVVDSAFRVQQQKNGDAKMRAWFESVGSKIQCIIGGEVVGSYGDLIRLN
jgi:hypothetical protein